MYQNYQTDALVLGVAPIGEGSARFTLLTRALGLVTASAQGVRKEKSKLRYSLQPFSCLSVVLVRGKETWKVVGALNADHLFVRLKGDPAKRALVARLAKFSERMLQGEEKNEYLFATLSDCFVFLSNSTFSPEELLTLEALTVARMLHSLGYFKGEPRHGNLFETTVCTPALILALKKEKPVLIRAVNTSLKESQL